MSVHGRSVRGPRPAPFAIARRELLRRGLASVGAAAAARAVTLTGLLTPSRGARAAGGRRFLVLVRLGGGNDGLNTVIPWQDAAYLDARPSLRVTEGVHVLGDRPSLAFHPRLTNLARHHADGRLAVVLNVGYGPASLSHFRSDDIWQSADPVGVTGTGWIGRWLDTLAPPGDAEVRGFDVAYGLDRVFQSDHANVFAFPGVEGVSFPTDDGAPWSDAALQRASFEAVCLEPRAPGSAAEEFARGGYVFSRNVDVFAPVAQIPLETDFPRTSRLALSFLETARMIRAARASGLEVGVFQVAIDGFDTHSDQDAPGGHADLWGTVDAALDAFHAELTAQGAAGDVLVVVYSEFGRRVEENGSAGTDHGTAAPLLVFGDPVLGGVIGADPDLTDLDADGNLRFEHDFRRVYATVLADWLGTDPAAVLGGTFETLQLLR